MAKGFAALNAECDRITAVAARWGRNGEYVLEGFSQSPAGGFKNGVIIDLPVAVDSVMKVMDKLYLKTGLKVQDVYSGVSSTSIKLVPSSGVLLLSKYGREVLPSDIKKCINIGATIKLPLEKEKLHNIIQDYSIDDEEGINDPRNLEGVKLGVDMKVITVNSSVLRNLSKCISQAGYLPAGFIYSGLAASFRTFDEKNKHARTAVLHIAGDMTEAAIFQGGILRSSKVFSKGTHDILMEDGDIDTFEIENFVRPIKGLDLWEKVDKVMVIGEGAITYGLIEALESCLRCKINPGVCSAKPFEELPPERAAYIIPLGILDHLQEERRKSNRPRNFFLRNFDRVISFIDRYF